jgi:hypothetical protein
VLDVLVAFDDPWLNYGPILTAPPDRVAEVFVLAPITPRLVEQLVRAGLADGWRPADSGAPMRFTLDRGRDRIIPRQEGTQPADTPT